MYLPYGAGPLILSSLLCLYLVSCAYVVSLPCLLCLHVLYLYLIGHDYLVIVFHVYPVGKADCSLLFLPSML